MLASLLGVMILLGMIGYADQAKPEEYVRSVVSSMAGLLVHQESDCLRLWIDQACGVALANWHKTASDSPSTTYCMPRNVVSILGTVYNLHSISQALKVEGTSWLGALDAGTLPAAIETWGLERTLQQINGAFAMAVWNLADRTLKLARDRVGKKSLYYTWVNDTFVFASELKALRAHPDFRPEINRDALTLLLRHNCIPAPYSIYTGVFKLPPGSVLTIDVGAPDQRPQPIEYWSLRDAAELGSLRPLDLTPQAAVERCHSLLLEATRIRITDAQFGAFLSGGIDSSTVAAIAQSLSSRPVKTFTIGFCDDRYDEAKQARVVAEHLGTDHTELYVSPEEAMDAILLIPYLYDEPFADSSQIPTILVSQLAGKHVDVVLAGDGGDEFFAGYNRYVWGRAIWNRIGNWPRSLRTIASRVMLSVPPRRWERLFATMGGVLPEKLRVRNPGGSVHKLAGILDVSGPEDMYRRLTSHWVHPEAIVLDGHELPTLVTDRKSWAEIEDFTQRMMHLDAVTYLPDDILVKVERAARGAGIETRAPLLDRHVIEFAWQLPLCVHIQGGEGKWVLRRILDKYVPQELVDRPKTGFGVPIGEWLRGPLLDWAEALLDANRLGREGFFQPEPIRKAWEEHLSGREDWQYHLWDILMFQAWFESTHKS